MRFGDCPANAVGDRDEEEDEDYDEDEVEPEPGARADGEEESDGAEGKRAVALPHRAIVAPRSADEEGGRPGKLARPGEHDDDHHDLGGDAGNGGEGQVEGGIREKVAELVQEGAE